MNWGCILPLGYKNREAQTQILIQKQNIREKQVKPANTNTNRNTNTKYTCDTATAQRHFFETS